MNGFRLATIFFIAFLFSCKASKDQSKTETNPAETVSTEPSSQQDKSMEHQILGNWIWWKTNCCYRTPHTTFANEIPFQKSVKFGNDGTLQRYNADTLKLTSKYKVEYGLMNDDNRPILRIDDRPAMLFINGDTLIIDFGYMDLQTEFYLKGK